MHSGEGSRRGWVGRSAGARAVSPAFLALGLVLLPDVADAKPAVSWSAPEECPSPEAFETLLTRSLGEPLERFESAARFRAQLERVGEVYRLTVEDETGAAAPRVLEDARCEPLADAAAVVIALALQRERDARVEAQATGADDTGDPGAPAHADSTSAVVAPSSTPAERRTSGEGMLSAGLLADSGVLPQLAPGARLGGGYRLGTVAAFAHLGFVGPRSTEHTPGGRFWLLFVDGDLCVAPIVRPEVVLDVCATIEGGWLSGRGSGVSAPRTGTIEWLALGGRVGPAFRLGSSPWRANLGVALLGALNRSPFVLDERSAVHQAEPAIGRVEIGVSRNLR